MATSRGQVRPASPGRSLPGILRRSLPGTRRPHRLRILGPLLLALSGLSLVLPAQAQQARVLEVDVFPPTAEVRAFLPGGPPAGDVISSTGEVVLPEKVLLLPVRISAEGFETKNDKVKLLKDLAEKRNHWRYETALRPETPLAHLQTQWHFHPWRTLIIAGGAGLSFVLFLVYFRKRLKEADLKARAVQTAAALQVEELKQKLHEGSVELEGEVIDNYTVVKTLGEGAYSRVYQARHNDWDDLAAVKILKQETKDAEMTARMRREIAIGRELKHPNIVKMYAFGTFRGSPYIVTEFVPGRPLDEVLEGEAFAVGRACRIGEQIVAGLKHAHEKGVIHRDLKPGNLFLTPKDEVKILDFGLARLLESDQKLTKTGQALGTPLYMSPEQIRGKAGAESDFYSFGVIFFEMLAGRPPFGGTRAMELLSAHAFKRPPDLREENPEVPAELAELVSHLLVKRPERRLSEADEILEVLGRFKD